MDTTTLLITYILGAIWFILPGYVANSTPTIFGGGPAIDGGRKWRDGKRILGPGKTWRGLIVGVTLGTLFGLLQGIFIEQEMFKVVIRAFMLSFGALLGDAMGSFIKRRKRLERGESFLFMDQLGFIIVGIILVILFFPLTIEGISFTLLDQIISYNIETIVIYFIVLLPLTFIVHVFANLFWYTLGRQEHKL